MKKSNFSSISIYWLTLCLLIINSLVYYLVLSSPETVTVLDPPDSQVIYQNSPPKVTESIGHWYFLLGFGTIKNSTKGTFQTLFYASCSSSSRSITIEANSSFYGLSSPMESASKLSTNFKQSPAM